MLVFMLPDKGAFQYLRIKKSSDCRYGVVSQCVQNLHVQKCTPQYLSNVLMKFNAKLGGTTAKVASVSAHGSSNVSSVGLLTGLASGRNHRSASSPSRHSSLVLTFLTRPLVVFSLLWQL